MLARVVQQWVVAQHLGIARGGAGLVEVRTSTDVQSGFMERGCLLRGNGTGHRKTGISWSPAHAPHWSARCDGFAETQLRVRLATHRGARLLDNEDHRSVVLPVQPGP